MSHVRSLIPLSMREKFRYLRACALTMGLNGAGNHVLSLEERKASSYISVVVPIHDAPEFTDRCLRSLERNGGKAEIILVDDGSRLERTKKVIDHAVTQNGWALVHHDSARGHSRACELGAEIAQRDYICFLNSDTVITPFSWAGMIQVLGADHRVAVVGPSTSSTSTSQTIWRAECCRFFWTDEQIDEFASRYTARNHRAVLVDMEYVGGFAFIVTRSAWREGGGFDPNLPNYGNEVELCRRLKRKGYRILWTRSSYVHHFEASSFMQRASPEELHHQRLRASRYLKTKSEEGGEFH